MVGGFLELRNTRGLKKKKGIQCSRPLAVVASIETEIQFHRVWICTS